MPARSRNRRRWFRVLALLLVPVGLLAGEVICRWADWGRPDAQALLDPGFSSPHSLFRLDESGTRYVIRPERLKFFVPESFPARKGPRTFRIFCLGGSTVQGRPYGKETSFTTWLELSLQAADSSREWEVINGGGVSYASYRLVPILQECLAYAPDLFILCTGHNEFLEDHTYAAVKQAPRLAVWGHQLLMHSRLYGLLQAVIRRTRSHSANGPIARLPPYAPEVDALLDYRNGLDAYHRDPAWRAHVIADYERNLRRLIALARAANVPVLAVRPPSNLRDCPPFKSQHRDGLTAEERRRWTAGVESARSQYETNLPQAIAWLQQAIKLDPVYADTFYSLGKCYEALARPAPARAALLQARELDICPLRMLAPLEQALARVAHATGTPLVDAHDLLERRSAWHILGNDWLVDHIHPNLEGHQLIAGALLTVMAGQGWVHPQGDWQAGRDARYQRHLKSLDELYFLHGQRRLRNLEAWTQGRADGPSITTRRRPADARSP